MTSLATPVESRQSRRGGCRFTQAGGVFDHVSLKGTASPRGWSSEAMGEMNRTDWAKHHKASETVVETNGTITATGTGTGDIGLTGTEGGRPVERTLTGLTVALLIVLVVAVRFATAEYRREPAGGAPVTRQVLAAKATVVGVVTFLTGLLAVGTVIPFGLVILKANEMPAIEVSTLTGVRVVVGSAAVLARGRARSHPRRRAAPRLARDPRRRLGHRGPVRRDCRPAPARRPVPVAATGHSGRRLRRPADPADPADPAPNIRRASPTTRPPPGTSGFRGGPGSQCCVRTR